MKFITIVLSLTLILFSCTKSQESIDKEFLRAAERGDIKEVKKYLKLGAHVDLKSEYGTTALMMASHGGDVAVVMATLDFNASPFITDNYGKTALKKAYAKGHMKIVTLLKERIELLEEEALEKKQENAVKEEQVESPSSSEKK